MRQAFAFVITGLLLTVACTDGDTQPREVTPTATATAMPTEETRGDTRRPPDLVVTVGDAAVTAGVGGYCWSGGCVDAVGVVTSRLALVSDFLPPLVAGLPEVTVQRVTASAWRIDDRVLCAPNTFVCGPLRAENGFVWPFDRLGEGRELQVQIDTDTLRVPLSHLTPGTYVISLSLAFQGGRDVNYGVLLTILPSEG